MTIQPERTDAEIEALLDYLKANRGFDLSAYKRSSLLRRIDKRLQALKIGSLTEYIDYLEVHPEEFAHLFDTILINVTDFFRDAPAWEALTKSIAPRIVEMKQPDETIRIWSAGCSSGQETYSLAMAFAELLGEEMFRLRVKIYGTDADEGALNEARQASYTSEQIQNVPEALREKYFEPVNGRICFRKDLRRSVIFGRHDLLQDAPISRVDLLVCRNTLMYFNAEAQQRILSRFDFALNGGGFLFLGKAEVLLTRSSAFMPVDLKHRLFAKLPKPRLRDLMAGLEGPGGQDPDAAGNEAWRLRELAQDLDPVAQIVADANGRLVAVNAQARLLFGLSMSDAGKRLQDLQLAYRPVELRFPIDQSFAERRPITLREVEWLSPGGEKRFLDVLVMPLGDPESTRLGVKVIFSDVTRFRRLQDDLHQTRQDLETTNEELQSSNEELETTNEELQSTVEELETTNEELQSTNEEMETMNEELQSTNEELQAINDQMQRRSVDLNILNTLLGSIMSSLREAVAVVDRDLNVIEWNRSAEELWGLRAGEVRGKNLANLDFGLPLDRILRPIRDCFCEESTQEALLIDATNRRGKSVRIKLSCTRLVGDKDVLQGVIVMMEKLDS